MGRIKETFDTINDMNEIIQKQDDSPILCLYPLLAQIAISLAVLAENVQGQIDQRNALARLFTGDSKTDGKHPRQ